MHGARAKIEFGQFGREIKATRGAVRHCGQGWDGSDLEMRSGWTRVAARRVAVLEARDGARRGEIQIETLSRSKGGQSLSLCPPVCRASREGSSSSRLLSPIFFPPILLFDLSTVLVGIPASVFVRLSTCNVGAVTHIHRNAAQHVAHKLHPDGYVLNCAGGAAPCYNIQRFCLLQMKVERAQL